VKILLTHSPEARALYYGERALSKLKESGTVKLNAEDQSLEGEKLVAAARTAT
jgi:D-3-phosphoglycerate dehydrogenase